MPYAASDIPGMVETIEQELLYDVGVGIRLAPDEVVCEFGALFGRSTMALAEGLMAAGTRVGPRDGACLVTHDMFSCSKHGQLWPYVISLAERNGVANLLKREPTRIDFLPIFDHYTAGLPEGLLERKRTSLANARHDGRIIAAMHIDAPKFYPEYMQLLREFGPWMRPGCLIVFQDFFYHWSAGLISMVQVMLEARVIEPLETAASSLLVRTRDAMPLSVIEAFASTYRRSDPLDLVRRAAEQFRQFDMHDGERFRPRLLLAAWQYAVESGRVNDAESARRAFERACPGEPTGGIAEDVRDLESQRFSMRGLYELDVT